MNKYAETALKAAKYIEEGYEPKIAWDKASKEMFAPGSPAQKKGCPKNAFLGLYGISSKNAEYSLKGLDYLRKNGVNNIDEKNLWNIITNNTHKAYNSQMHVLLALFRSGYIK